MQNSIHISAFQVDTEILSAAQMSCACIFNNANGQLQDSDRTQRVTYNYGLDYFKMLKGDFSETAIPLELQNLCGAALGGFEQSLDRKLPHLSQYKNCIISLYRPGFKLQPHIDTDVNEDGQEFYFGDDIIGVVVQSDQTGKLYIQPSLDGLKPSFDQTKASFLNENNGLAYLLTGELRQFPNFHGVSEVTDRRVSITYRTVEFK